MQRSDQHTLMGNTGASCRTPPELFPPLRGPPMQPHVRPIDDRIVSLPLQPLLRLDTQVPVDVHKEKEQAGTAVHNLVRQVPGVGAAAEVPVESVAESMEDPVDSLG